MRKARLQANFYTTLDTTTARRANELCRDLGITKAQLVREALLYFIDMKMNTTKARAEKNVVAELKSTIKQLCTLLSLNLTDTNAMAQFMFDTSSGEDQLHFRKCLDRARTRSEKLLAGVEENRQ